MNAMGTCVNGRVGWVGETNPERDDAPSVFESAALNPFLRRTGAPSSPERSAAAGRVSEFAPRAVPLWRFHMHTTIARFAPTPATARPRLVEPRKMATPAPTRWTATVEFAVHTGSPVRLHRTEELFVDHVERHFATAEAIAALEVAEPSVARRAAFRSGRAMVRATRAAEGEGARIDLLEGYAECARRTLDQAAALGWIVSPSRSVDIAFAPTGLLVVIERGVLRTMFFPGLESDEDRALRQGLGSAELAAERVRKARWSPLERHFYRVFRPALQRIRSFPDDRAAGAVGQYGALKRVLPSASALGFEGWTERLARARAATGGDA